MLFFFPGSICTSVSDMSYPYCSLVWPYTGIVFLVYKLCGLFKDNPYNLVHTRYSLSSP